MKETNMYTGTYGIVLLPTPETAAFAQKRGEEICDNEIKLGTTHLPHLTLYHTKVTQLPRETVREALHLLAPKLPLTVTFTKLAPFGGKFAFLDTQCTEPLVQLHEQALAAISPFYDSRGVQQADSEALSLTPEEADNVKHYGHPLVGGLWRPHITVGYVASGYTAAAKVLSDSGEFDRVAFVCVGEYGTIAELILTA